MLKHRSKRPTVGAEPLLSARAGAGDAAREGVAEEDGGEARGGEARGEGARGQRGCGRDGVHPAAAGPVRFLLVLKPRPLVDLRVSTVPLFSKTHVPKV